MSWARSPWIAVVALAGIAGATPPPAGPAGASTLPFSRAFLGAYRLTLEIDAQILKHCATYGVDPHWARAICLYESGGNPDLSSHVGAAGYFQVMPRTYRGLGVSTNVEAGIKYLSQMRSRYGREDYATAAYNGGPLFVDKDRAFKLETLQYVIGVGHFRNVLQRYEEQIRPVAATLDVHIVKPGETWWSISQATGIPIMELRMYNPFLAHRGTLEAGNLIARPRAPGPLDFTYADGVVSYTSRIGDNPFWVSYVFGAKLDAFRETNDIWRLQPLPEGVPLTIDLAQGATPIERVVLPEDTLLGMAGNDEHAVWDVVRAGGLFEQKLVPGQTLKLYTLPPPAPVVVASVPELPRPAARAGGHATYKVKKGDTISSIAKKFDTTPRHIQRLNGVRTKIFVGQTLKVPAAGTGG